MITYSPTFPQQRVDESIKEKPDWYANCIDYIIDAGIAYNDRTETEVQLAILHGDVPDSFYKKTLNPYNSNNERFTRFPATMRNYDIMSDIIRRYVSEYHKGVHDFTVGANNPEIVLKRNAKLNAAVRDLAQQAFQQELQARLAQLQQQAQEQGMPPERLILNKQCLMLNSL